MNALLVGFRALGNARDIRQSVGGLLLLGVLLLTGCSPNLARRYRQLQDKPEELFEWAPDIDVPTYADVDLNSYVVESAQPATPSPVATSLLSLTGEGQAALIKAIDGRIPPSGVASLSVLVKQLADNFPNETPATPKVKVISRTLKKSLVFTVDRKRFHSSGVFNHPADRLAYLELSVGLLAASPLRFNSWDRFVTKEATVDLGQVTSAREWNASVTGNVGSTNVVSSSTGGEQSETTDGPAAAAVATDVAKATTTTKTSTGGSLSSTLGLGVSGTAGVTNKYSTALSLTSRILALSGTLTPLSATVVQEGAQGIDLSGNQALAVEYTTTAGWATPIWVNKLPARLYSAAGVATPANTLTLPGFYEVFPAVPPVKLADGSANPAASFIATLRYRFLYRKVQRGNRHLPEAKHRALYVLGQAGYGSNPSQKSLDPLTADIITNGKAVVLAQSSDYRPLTYRLSYTVPGSNPADSHFVCFNNQPVQFETVQEALTFLQYLHDVAAAPPVPGFSIANLTTVLNSDAIPNIKVVSYQN